MVAAEAPLFDGKGWGLTLVFHNDTCEFWWRNQKIATCKSVNAQQILDWLAQWDWAKDVDLTEVALAWAYRDIEGKLR